MEVPKSKNRCKYGCGDAVQNSKVLDNAVKVRINHWSKPLVTKAKISCNIPFT